MEKFDSITHFLQSGEFECRIFDMGRKVVAISNGDFEGIENQSKKYPYPLQKKAWLALLFWSRNSSKEPIIWFLQFPIDEMGYLKQEARDGFLIGLLEQAGKNLQAKLSGNGEVVVDELNESPYAFKPQEDRLAIFHAFATKALGESPSRYYQATREYLLGKLGYEQWQFLGLQGIADFVVRLDYEDNDLVLAKAISLMPDMPVEVFCRALENVSFDGELAESIERKLMRLLENKSVDDVRLSSMLLRACSGIESDEMRQSLMARVLRSKLGSDVEILVSISGRSWKDLFSGELLSHFLENIAKLDQSAFNVILEDLMMIPKMKENVLAYMKSLKQASALKNSFDTFLQGVKK